MRVIAVRVIILLSVSTVNAYADASQERQNQADEKFLNLIEKTLDDSKTNEDIYRELRRYLTTSWRNSRIKPNFDATTQDGRTALEIYIRKIKSLENDNSSPHDILKTHYKKIVDLLISSGAKVKVEDLFLVIPAKKNERPNELARKLLNRFDQTPLTIDDLKKAMNNDYLVSHILEKDPDLIVRKLVNFTNEADFQSWACQTRNRAIEERATQTALHSRFQLLKEISQCPALMNQEPASLSELNSQLDEIRKVVTKFPNVCHREVGRTDHLLDGLTNKLHESLTKYLQERDVEFDPVAVKNGIETFLRNRSLPTQPQVLSLGKGLGNCTWVNGDQGEIFLTVKPDKKELLGRGSFKKTLRVLELQGGEFKPMAVQMGDTNSPVKNLEEMEKEEAIIRAIGPNQKGINVPRIVQFKDAKGNVVKWSVAPIYEQGDLDYVIKDIDKDPTLTPTQKLDKKLVYLRGAAEGEANLHKMDIVHVDLKPDNVLIGGGQAYVHDFGLAKILNATKLDYKVFATGGTIGYVAPECFSKGVGWGIKKKERIKKRDVFSLGVMLADELAKLLKSNQSNHFVSNRFKDFVQECKESDQKSEKKNEKKRNCISKKVLGFNKEMDNLVKKNKMFLTSQQKSLFKLADKMMDPDPDKRPTMRKVAVDLNRFSIPKLVLPGTQPLSLHK